MDEAQFASHCEAVAQLLRQWGAVEYFCDYIASTKKRREFCHQLHIFMLLCTRTNLFSSVAL